jgi:hypothetical protein
MKYVKIIINSIIVIIVILRWMIIRKKREITYFNPRTGQADYKTTYYLLMIIPVWIKIERTPKYK